MRLRDLALAALATARLTRLITTDAIGERYVQDPVDRWADFPVTPATRRLYGPDVAAERERREFLADGLRCPHCVGFWIGAGVLGLTRLTSPTSRTGRAWRFAMTALGLNAVVATVGTAVGYWGESEEAAD